MNEGLRKLYEIEKRKPTDAQRFIDKVAQAACVSDATVRNWIGGRQKPSNPAVMNKVAEALGADVQTLFNIKQS